MVLKIWDYQWNNS